eukprot:TRINITY_DN2902_c0_g1_i2.p1 TRINITY_DN2902_c0_g1~~TRINITY_DN2902_c0_g1_i2.p1  ORF type:complete len:227 (+),score=30.60 TRINITY_DN2902_c0_g1_i2:791-1471(+)
MSVEEQCLVMWINITLNEEFTLDSKTLKNLTLISHCIANALKNYVEENYWFDLRRTRRTTYYSLHNQKNVLDISEIMATTKRVAFHDVFTKDVNNLLPCQLTSIKFGIYFDRVLNLSNLPHLTHLDLGYFFNKSIDQALPDTVTHLSFSGRFNHNVSKLPSHLTHVEFGWSFNKYIESLPLGVKQVRFPPNYHQSIAHLSQKIQFQTRHIVEGIITYSPFQHKPQP